MSNSSQSAAIPGQLGRRDSTRRTRTLEEVVDDVVRLESRGPRADAADGVEHALVVDDGDDLQFTTHPVSSSALYAGLPRRAQPGIGALEKTRRD